MSFAREAEAVHQKYAAKGRFGAFFVIANGASGLPSRDECRATQRRNNLTMPVLYDPQGRLAAVGLDDRHYHFVLDGEGRIDFKKQFEDREFQARLDALLGP